MTKEYVTVLEDVVKIAARIENSHSGCGGGCFGPLEYYHINSDDKMALGFALMRLRESERDGKKSGLTIKELQSESHRIAVQKGWWGDKDRNVPEQIALMHSELSEALEEYRNGKPLDEVYYREDGKPEGFGVELCDVLIRCADTAERYGINLTEMLKIKMAYNETRPHRHGGKKA